MSSQDRVRMYTRTRCRKPMLDVDLNDLPPCETYGHEGTSTHARSLERQEGIRSPNAPIDLDTYDDDDVIISSPRTFAQARNNSRRNHDVVVVDVDSGNLFGPGERPSRNKRRHTAREINMNGGIYINLEGSSSYMPSHGQAGPMPPAVNEPLTFKCPVCIGPLVEEMSTKCGHIFCKECIRIAIAAQGKCPTCRKKITTRDMFRIYLPAATATSD